MNTFPALGDRQGVNAEGSIYKVTEPPASERGRSESRVARAASGFMLGAALWLVISQLGVPSVIGLGVAGGELPFGIAGALIGLSRFRSWLLWTSVSLVVFLSVVGLTGIFAGPARALVRSDRVPANADAVVVLSSGVTSDGLLTQQGTDRLRRALELTRAGVAPVLVVTRERRRSGRSSVTSARDQDKLIALAGVEHVISTGWAKSTHDEAMFVEAIARKEGWKRIVLVTSPFHSRRACATFEKVGLVVSCVPAESRDVSVRMMNTPRDRVGAFAMWIYEVAGTMRYRQQGWM